MPKSDRTGPDLSGAEICSANAGGVLFHGRLGGLHHRYDGLPELMLLAPRRHACTVLNILFLTGSQLVGTSDQGMSYTDFPLNSGFDLPYSVQVRVSAVPRHPKVAQPGRKAENSYHE